MVARSKHEMFYVEDFDQLAAEFPNFTWHVARPTHCLKTTGGMVTRASFTTCLRNHLKKKPRSTGRLRILHVCVLQS